MVAPHAGAWIETPTHTSAAWSLPMRGRGSKLRTVAHRSRSPSLPMRGRGSKPLERGARSVAVAPHAGAWIETPSRTGEISSRCRSPCGGVDRNMPEAKSAICLQSLPMRGRGSKLPRSPASFGPAVAPHAGAWIETSSSLGYVLGEPCRSPCGGVDRNSAKSAAEDSSPRRRYASLQRTGSLGPMHFLCGATHSHYECQRRHIGSRPTPD